MQTTSITECDKIDTAISSRSFNRCSFSLDSVSPTWIRVIRIFSFFSFFFFAKSTVRVELFKRNGGKKKKDTLHINLHRDMTIFLFFSFLSFRDSFSRRISCFQKKLSFIFRPLLCPYHTGFQENLHNFAYPHISPTSVSLFPFYQFLEFSVKFKPLSFLIRDSRQLTTLVPYLRQII